MKIKSLTMLIASSLLTLSCAYIAPVWAEDDMNNGQSMQQPGSTDKADQNYGSSTNDDSSANSTNGTDEGSPDTATGDDDY